MHRSCLSIWRNRTLRSFVFLFVVASPVLGCATGPTTSHVENEMSSLKTFLQDGTTQREAVIVKLGIPHATFEDGRILGYYLSATDELILVFDAQGRLARHRFIKYPRTQS